MGFVKRRESFRFDLLAGSDWHCSIVGFKEEGSGHALVDFVSGPEEGRQVQLVGLDRCCKLAGLSIPALQGTR